MSISESRASTEDGPIGGGTPPQRRAGSHGVRDLEGSRTPADWFAKFVAAAARHDFHGTSQARARLRRLGFNVSVAPRASKGGP